MLPSAIRYLIATDMRRRRCDHGMRLAEQQPRLHLQQDIRQHSFHPFPIIASPDWTQIKKRDHEQLRKVRPTSGTDILRGYAQFILLELAETERRTWHITGT